MRKNQSSLTAAGIAIAHALESEKPVDERICYDPYARQFIQAWMYRLLVFFIKSGYAELRGLGMAGQLLYTPGHCIDHIAIVLDSGEAFCGDAVAQDARSASI